MLEISAWLKKVIAIDSTHLTKHCLICPYDSAMASFLASIWAIPFSQSTLVGKPEL